ncbi:hypothetical protein AAFF_G00318910 [Aldrovandia affinis]|uniref:Uncharacterized protein n=1 Tax=Aldrovandia affinis TaxID=143900 RepID=A0AAD7WQM2_9TELE|nr:hypothetical protein AAFF_G00318910 [Aldrovandia affinis]
MATGMESLKETVAAMLKDSLKEALDPITKQMVENGNILRSLKEQSETHAKKFDTVFNKIDSMQVDLRKSEKETSSCFSGGHIGLLNNTSRPRTMIFKLLRYTDRQAILAGARKARPLSLAAQLLFFADYSPGATQERQGYRDSREAPAEGNRLVPDISSNFESELQGHKDVV